MQEERTGKGISGKRVEEERKWKRKRRRTVRRRKRKEAVRGKREGKKR